MRPLLYGIVISGILVIAGCLPLNQGSPEPVANTGIPTPSVTIMPSNTPVSTPAVMLTSLPEMEQTITPGQDVDRLAGLVKKSLASKLGVPVADINVISVDKVTWPDTSLGCPLKGVLYTQVLTPGYAINLEAGGKPYIYHTDTIERIVYCPAVLPDGSVPTIEIPPPRN